MNELEQKSELLIKYREKIKEINKYHPLATIIKYTINSSYGFFSNPQPDEKVRQFNKTLLDEYNILITKCETFLNCKICFSCFKLLNISPSMGIGITRYDGIFAISSLISGGIYGYYCPRCMKSYCKDCYIKHSVSYLTN